jgi:hypothetical protein
MIKKNNRDDCLWQYPIFPWRRYDHLKDDDTFFYPKVHKTYIFTLPSVSFRGNANLMGIQLTHMAKTFGSDSLLFLGDTETPWLYQSNTYNPVQAVLLFLQQQKIGRKFNGGLKVSMAFLPVFIKHLCWITRCNASLPYFYFTTEDGSILGNICQYGNLHLDTLDEKADKKLYLYLGKSVFCRLGENICLNRFGKSGAIRGRQLNL